MQVRTVRYFLFLIVFYSVSTACFFPSSSNNPPSLPSRIQIEMIPPEHAIQGEPADYTFIITNQTDYSILPLELLPKSRDVAKASSARTVKPIQDGAVHHWTHLLNGPLEHHPDKNEFSYTPSKQEPPQTVKGGIYSGLLQPGQSLRVKLRILHLEHGRFTQHFSLRYHRTTPTTLQKRLYIPESPLGSSRNQTRTVRFQSQQRTTQKQFPNPEYFLIYPSFQIVVEQTFSRDIRVFKGFFQPFDARERIKKRIGPDTAINQMRYDPWNERWIIRMDNNQTWSVSQKSTERLPDGSFTDFKYLATAEGPVYFYPGPRLPSNSERLDPLSSIPAENDTSQRRTDVRKAIELLQTLRESGLKIEWTREPLTNHPAAIVKRSSN